MRHRRRRIQADSFFECTDRFLVIEGVHETQTLIEIPLRLLGSRCDSVMESAQIVEERNGR